MRYKIREKERIYRIAVLFIVIAINLNVFLLQEIATAETTKFIEDFETGYDGWSYYDGNLTSYGPQSTIVYDGNYAFKMTGTIDTDGAYAGNYKHALNISVSTETQFTFAYFFPSKEVSYVGYYLTFNNNKLGQYFSFFSGSFVNISATYVLQYRNEAVNTWHSHTTNVYNDYQRAFGSTPSDLRITGIYMMMGDPYYTHKTQTSYFDGITIATTQTQTPISTVQIWIQEWLSTVLIISFIIVVILGIGLYLRSKAKIRIVEKEKQEIKDIIHQTTLKDENEKSKNIK